MKASARGDALGSIDPPRTEAFAPRLDLIRHLEPDHFWFRGRRELLRRLLRRFVPRKGASILDVGCGSGFFMKQLEEDGFIAVGIDPLAVPSEEKGRRSLVRGDGLVLPFRAESFSAVTILDVLEHVDEATLLGEVRRVLARDGVAIITVPASSRLWSSRDVEAGHLRRYSRKALVHALTLSGLEPRFITHYQFFLFPLMVVARTAGRSSPGVRIAEEQPGKVVNRLLGMLNVWEARCAPYLRWPWGSSLVAVCLKA